MNLIEFTDEVTNILKDELKECRISLKEVVKNNGVVLTGICFVQDGMNASPTIYLNDYYYEMGERNDPSKIAKEIIKIYKENPPREINLEEMLDNYEHVRDKIYCRLVSAEKNKEILENTPHIEFLDMAITAYLCLGKTFRGDACITINDEICKHWDIDGERLVSNAYKNTRKKISYRRMSVYSILEEMREHFPGLPEIKREEIDNSMYILASDNMQNGAILMTYKDILDKMYSEFHSGFYILPSSIHEVIIVPAEDTTSLMNYRDMVIEVNATSVPDTEILSDNAYYYEPSIGYLRAQ